MLELINIMIGIKSIRIKPYSHHPDLYTYYSLIQGDIICYAIDLTYSSTSSKGIFSTGISKLPFDPATIMSGTKCPWIAALLSYNLFP